MCIYIYRERERYICCGRRRYVLLLHFSICACHPCAGATVIFSASFQI